jgi:hypothetical protein
VPGPRALGSKLLEHPLSGAQIDLLDNPRFAFDAGGAHPIEVREGVSELWICYAHTEDETPQAE